MLIFVEMEKPSPITYLIVYFLVHSASLTYFSFGGCCMTPAGEREREAVLLFSASRMLRVRADRARNKLSTAFTCPLIDLSISFSLSAHFT